VRIRAFIPRKFLLLESESVLVTVIFIFRTLIMSLIFLYYIFVFHVFVELLGDALDIDFQIITKCFSLLGSS